MVTVGFVHLRVILRSPDGETVVRDSAEERWAEPFGEPDLKLGADDWALPGLVDAHAHFARETMDLQPGDFEGARRRALAALESGVMLALDKGWRDLTVVDLIERVAAADRPDIETAGITHATEDGYYAGFARIIDPGGMAEAIGRAASESRGWVKLIGDWPRKGVGPLANFSEGELATAVAAARSAGAMVAVHTMAREVPSMAVTAGVHSIEHGLFLTTEDIEALGSRRGIWVPTVVQMEAVITQLGERSSGGRLIAEGLASVVKVLPMATEAGVHVLTGTDLAVGAHEVGREAVRLWEMGMRAQDVIRAISYSGLEATDRPYRFDIDAPADAVLFDVNPADDLGALAHPRHVVRHGRLVR